MGKQLLMAIDAGSGSVRAVLFDTEGNQVGCIQKEWTHKQDPRYPGSMDFDWDYNWQLTCTCIKGVINEAGISPVQICAVSTTCMREGIVLYNAEGKEIWACANVDARSNEEVAELVKSDPERERQLYLESGESYALGALPRLLWVKNNQPEIYEKTASIGMFNDWLIYKMSGFLAVEPSNGSTTGIFNLHKRAWNPDIARKCGLRTDIFPNVIECGQKAAAVSAQGASDTGLLEGTPLVVGGGDAQLGCIGVGVVNPGQAAIFGGSFWQYEYNTSRSDTDPKCRIRVNCHAVKDVWQYEALAFNPGLVMRWYRDAFCQYEVEQGAHSGEDPYFLMDQKAKEIPVGSNGMLCAFSDVMNFINWKHASPTFTNFSLDAKKFNRYTFYRAIMENTAMVTLGHMHLVREATGNMPKEVVFAGGASKSPVWCQILTDVLGIPVKVPVIREATALGAAILAGHGAGLYEDIAQTAQNLVKWANTYTPSMQNHKIYQSMYEKWRQVYAAQLLLSDQGLTQNMWRAPGI